MSIHNRYNRYSLIPLHVNEGREIDIKQCKQCQTEHVDEYKKYQKERENDPVVKEQKSMEKMYRGTLVNAITENQVRRQYGLTFEDGRVRDLADLFSAKVKKNVEDSTKKLRVIEHLQELAQEAEDLSKNHWTMSEICHTLN